MDAMQMQVLPGNKPVYGFYVSEPNTFMGFPAPDGDRVLGTLLIALGLKVALDAR